MRVNVLGKIRYMISLVIGERSEPLSRVFNDQPCDIYYGGVRTHVRF